jgi:hypothetical protein
MIQMATGAAMASAVPELFAQQAMPTTGELLNLKARRYAPGTNSFKQDTIANLLGKPSSPRILIFMAHTPGCLYQNILTPRLERFAETIQANLADPKMRVETVLLSPDRSVSLPGIDDDRAALEKAPFSALIYDDHARLPVVNKFRLRGSGEFAIAVEAMPDKPAIGVGVWTIGDATFNNLHPSMINVPIIFNELDNRRLLRPGANAIKMVSDLSRRLPGQLAITTKHPEACSM